MGDATKAMESVPTSHPPFLNATRITIPVAWETFPSQLELIQTMIEARDGWEHCECGMVEGTGEAD